MIHKAKHNFTPLAYHPETVVGEFSGRDSVAAILKAFERDDVQYILPVATFAGTEYGDFQSIYENYEKLQQRVQAIYGNKKTLYALHEYNREDLWSLINGRFMTKLVERFGFYTPCIGCHMYFHLTKIPFANELSRRIISGERESHDGRIKVNQLHICLESYKAVMKKLGFELMVPLQSVWEGDEVERLIGWDWAEGKDHPKCVLSGNYRNASGQAQYDEAAIHGFLEEYLIPHGILMGEYLMDERTLASVQSEVEKLL